MKALLPFVTSKFNQIETVLVILAAAGIFVMVNEIKWYSYPIIISFGGLMLLYWIMSMQERKETDTAIEHFYKKVFWLANTIGILGILLKLIFEQKAEMALLTGAITIFSALAFTIYRKFVMKKSEEFISNLIRGGVIGIVVLSMYLIS